MVPDSTEMVEVDWNHDQAEDILDYCGASVTAVDNCNMITKKYYAVEDLSIDVWYFLAEGEGIGICTGSVRKIVLPNMANMICDSDICKVQVR